MTRQAWMRAALALGWAMALAGCPGDEGGGGGVAGSGTVSGRVTYDFVPAVYSTSQGAGTLAFNQAEQRPARNAVVQVREGNTVLATGATDAQGNYSVSFDAKGTGALTVVALAKSVSPEIQVVDNTDGKSIWAIGDSIHTGANTMNLYATHGWTGSGYDPNKRAAAPFAILDTMYTEATAFQAVRPVVFPALKVNWSPDNVPEAGDKATGQIGTSHFAPDENEIYVLGKQGVDTDEFDSHVIAHEWGHYFESNLSRSDSPGGRHQGGDVLDPRLSFGEGYGNAIAAILLPDSMYVDTLWGGAGQLGAIGFDAEAPASPTDDPTPSAFSEMSVLRDPLRPLRRRHERGLRPDEPRARDLLRRVRRPPEADPGVDHARLVRRRAEGAERSERGAGRYPARALQRGRDHLRLRRRRRRAPRHVRGRRRAPGDGEHGLPGRSGRGEQVRRRTSTT